MNRFEGSCRFYPSGIERCPTYIKYIAHIKYTVYITYTAYIIYIIYIEYPVYIQWAYQIIMDWASRLLPCHEFNILYCIARSHSICHSLDYFIDFDWWSPISIDYGLLIEIVILVKEKKAYPLIPKHVSQNAIKHQYSQLYYWQRQNSRLNN